LCGLVCVIPGLLTGNGLPALLKWWRQRRSVMPGRILIVEDDAFLAILLRDLLHESGYEVVGVAADAQRAVQQAATGNPDLVLADIHLRGQVDGIQAAIEIKKRHNTEIVFLTSANDSATVERAKIARPAAYLNKPTDLLRVLDAVERALTDKHAG
jgi:CheY-like chemotaxis protein